MNDDTTDFDRIDDDILTETVSDEALEAAGTGWRGPTEVPTYYFTCLCTGG